MSRSFVNFKQRMKRKSTRFYLLAVAWAATIFVSSSTFIERSIFIDFVKRFIPSGMSQHLWVNFWASFGIFVVKAYHITEYAILSYLLFVVLKNLIQKNQSKALLVAAILAALYAISDEWHQTFVPGRGGTWVDVVIDCVGIGIAVAIITKKFISQKQR